MSSTSSSECVCDECFNYGQGLGNPDFRPTPPYYETLGHPLIYYAQVQQSPNYRRRSRESKQERPNCFVKAFRWYTQEHYPPQSRELPSDRTDLNGFAVWLDKKYDEFILDKRAEQTAFQVQPQLTSTLETNQNSNSVVCNLRVKKKFARVRSPWSKRRRPENSKDIGDVLDKCKQDFEFIMKPKELSRPASECCHQTSRNRSNVSSETVSKKTIIKSHSSDRTDYEKHVCVPNEVIKPEGIFSNCKLARSKSEFQIKLTKELKDVTCQCPEEITETLDVEVQCTIVDREALIECPLSDYVRNTNVMRETDRVEFSEGPQVRDEDGSKPKKFEACNPVYNIAKSDTNTSCQYSEIAVGKQDAQNQYTWVTDAVCCCCCYDFKTISHRSFSNQNYSRILLPHAKYAKSLEPQLPLLIKDPGTDTGETNPKIGPIAFASGEAQTSDHSICLDKNRYPLFMKIVRADKLNEEFIRK